jgi:hypothetical protein
MNRDADQPPTRDCARSSSRLPVAKCIVAGSILLATACHGRSYSRSSAEPAISVDEHDLRVWMSAIADDSMQGRLAGSVGHARTVRYLVDQAARIGLTPAGEGGGFVQRVPELMLVVDTLTELRTDADRLTLGVDFRPFVDGRGQPRPIDGAHAIYGGVYGDSTTHIDRAAASGRIVVLSAPPGLTAGLAFRWMSYAPEHSRLGSAAAVAIESLDLFPPSQRQPFHRTAVNGLGDSRADAAPTTVHITSRAAALLLGAAPSSLKPATLGRTVRGRFLVAEKPRPSSNVVAMLPGQGSNKGQVVVLTAHSDHLGVSPAAGGDSIWNGADDNASGTVALLAIAKSLQPSRLDRSVLFVWFTSEEQGMGGSRWFASRPTVPGDSIVALFNLDMVGRGEGPPGRKNPPHLVRAIIGGPPSNLDATLARANAIARRPVAIDTADVGRVFCSSDQRSFAHLGIPLVFFNTDKHVDYHQPTDEAARIDYERLGRVAELVATVVRSLEERPRAVTGRNPKALRDFH